MALTLAQISAREGKLTASRMAGLMTGDHEKILNLWRELVGDPNYKPMTDEDFAGIWPVALGSCTENLNLDWYARKHGPVTRRGEVAVMAGEPWAAATLDGWSQNRNCPIEAKHVGGREEFAVIVERYHPQVHWTMLVTGRKMIDFTVIVAANEPRVDELPLFEKYAREMMERARQFMRCVEGLTPPVPMPVFELPKAPTREVSMEGNNEWATAAVDFVRTADDARTFKIAKELLKGMVPFDAKFVKGHGVVATRNRAGAIKIQEAAHERNPNEF